MTFFQWRRFNFFDLSKDCDGGALQKWTEGVSPVCFSCGRGHFVFGDAEGRLHWVNRHWERVTVDAFPLGPLYLVQQLKQSGILLAVGEEDPGVNPYLKVYDLDKPDKNSAPTLLRVSRVALSGGRVSRPCCLSAHENRTLLALGYEDGSVVLHTGDVTRERGGKTRVLVQGEGDRVTGLAFKGAGKKNVLLYVATERSVVCFRLEEKDREVRNQLDNVGCEPGLAILAENLLDAHFLTARDDAVYCYTPEGRGQCYAFEGKKVHLHWFRNYLVVVSASHDDDTKHIVTLFDVHNKFIAFTAPVKPVKALFTEWGLLYALTDENKLYQLTEKDVQSKLDLLFKKNFYDVAVKVAKMQQYDEDGLVDIFRQYGDHLYVKGDYVGAIENYIKTIGHLEPSYVIRKFLDAHKIHNLTEYLQSLHSKSLANEDHTILLLNCYTKLKDNNRLDDFIFKENLDFDVDIAIKVCRQSGYNKHALALAERHGKHEWYLKMQIEDLKGFGEALNYIAKLDFESAEKNLRKYGSALMHQLPDDTTELLKNLCNDYRPRDDPIVKDDDEGGGEETTKSAEPEQFLHLFVKNSDKMVDFLDHMIRVRPESSPGVYSTLLEHYLHLYSDKNRTDDAESRAKQEDKAMEILRKNVDEDQALILCQRHGFRKGALHLYERKHLYDQILSHHVQYGDVDAAVATCRKFGSQDPNLWVQALQYIAREGEATQAQMAEILGQIEKHRLLSPILVVGTLARSANTNLDLVSDYLLKMIELEDEQLKEDDAVIDKYRKDTEELRQGNKRLNDDCLEFQVSKCIACNHHLELPTIHFLCRHSYHEHCFQSYSDTETECPACQTKNKKFLEIIKSQARSREQHDEFHHQLDKAENSFSVVAEYFGRGLFRQEKALTDLAHKIGRVDEETKAAAILTSERLQQPHHQAAAARERSPAAVAADASRAARQRQPQSRPVEAPASTNPFGDEPSPERTTASTNPFGSPEKAKESSSANPFGEPTDDYDESLNPFGK